MMPSFAAPSVSNNDLVAFFEAHFSGAAVRNFQADFLNPHHQPDAAATNASVEEDGDVFEEEDDLGYYHDGVKRTLTDDQIAMFRHSELETIKREQERRSTAVRQAGETGEDGTLRAAESSRPPGKNAKNKKKKRGKGKGQEPKPDLRKRTWDVVESGLDTLDYD
ncbi:hypothetical protein HER10_EVM0012196 [Colletotrichum scovillei]|uniref:Uncharacterized protein n=1 Tax=Colletotrichum scovillei TaxID=1209932 RepID=A0A9P7U8X3_9PEZI|nr:uncharacterized protein HER10_EVM0012196 [Colletotrichum scovillei]KAF4784768.1 hypothetical protein HER10_EVM0012196 [Colletotrichum scovillei]KAG7044845.1 hypothetical protein JMJ77_0004305 [Colletotrichum scovillei]KAG7049557.1 hypothetical protein JMJ78_0013538 [Colletotrichum scovillei]KAG7064298.1 hypothetical protein JMJ76_0007344 [Colletotrichum scovillei]